MTSVDVRKIWQNINGKTVIDMQLIERDEVIITFSDGSKLKVEADYGSGGASLSMEVEE